MPHSSLTAVRQRVERLAAVIAQHDDVSTWTDARLRDGLTSVLAHLDPCVSCGADLARHASEALNADRVDFTRLTTCPTCGVSWMVMK